jgi:hypothetical protein
LNTETGEISPDRGNSCGQHGGQAASVPGSAKASLSSPKSATILWRGEELAEELLADVVVEIAAHRMPSFSR